MTEVARHNHFVPRLYLKQWSENGTKVFSYRLLVEHENIPPWNRVSIQNLGALADLYTQVIDGSEVDQFERWVKSEFEDPVVPVFDKIQQGADLTDDDWTCLARFFAAQDVRTPASLVESMERWAKEIPTLLNRVLREGVEEYSRSGSGRTKPPRRAEPGMDDLRRTFRVCTICCVNGRFIKPATAPRKRWRDG